MSEKIQRKTVTRTVTPRQHAALLWILENQERYLDGEIIDLSRYNNIPDVKEKHRYYVSEEENELIRDFLNNNKARNDFENYVKDWSVDSRKVTTPFGSTIRYKTVNTVVNPIVSTPTTPTPMSKDDIAEARKGIDGNKPVMPVYSDMERWSLALQLDKTKLDNDWVISNYNEFLKTANMSDYLFIKNMNEIASTMDKIDWKILFYMLETGKISSCEAKLIIEHFGATGFSDKAPRDFMYLGIPDFYKDDSTIVAAMIKAEDYSCKYELALQDPEPTREDILKRFKEYALRNRFTKILNQDLFSDPITDQIKSIKGKKVVLQSEEQDDPYTNEYTYVDQNMMINDFVCFEKAFKLDPNKVYDVFGTKMSINSYIEQLYQEYPHGFNDDFYRTRIEAYNAGAAQICDL